MLNTEYTIFEKEAKSRGYSPKYQIKNGHTMNVRSKNGINCSIKYIKRFGGQTIVIGYHSKGDEVKALLKTVYETMSENGYKFVQVSETYAGFKLKYENLEQYYKIVEFIENIEDVLIEYNKRNTYFEITYNTDRIAQGYFDAINRKDQIALNNHRIMLNADDFDNDIAINKPSDRRTYREHVVPCSLIHHEIIDRIMNKGAQLEEISDLIKKNLKIAYISNKDARHIDIDLGWRTDMPEGWNWGDSITARLDEAKISY